MTRLQQLYYTGTSAPVQTNVVIVPGHNRETLADQTCSHFPTWLDHLVASRQNDTVVWLFRHELQVDSLSSWYAYYEAGEALLQDLTRLQEDESLPEDATLILIGHKLGCFVLKKALREAHQASHRPNIDALLGTIDTLVMLGDPYLDPQHESEWIPLIRKCLPCKTLPERLSIAQDARCLERIAFHFEEFTLTSTLFQVSGSVERKRKHTLTLRRHTGDPRCICSANMTVRMWTTSAEEVSVSPGAGNIKNCAFHAESTLFKNLVSIPDYTRLSITSSRPLSQVQDAQEADTEDSSSLTNRKEPEPADLFAALRQTAPVDSRAASIDDTAPMSYLTSTHVSENKIKTCIGGGINMSAPHQGSPSIPLNPEHATSSAEMRSLSVSGNMEDALLDIKALLDIIFLEANNLQEAIVSGEDRQTDLIEEPHIRRLHIRRLDVQHYSLDISVTYKSPRDIRRNPLLTTRVPHRDANFFGREAMLAMMKNFLRPVLTPSGGRRWSLDSGTLLILYGVAGVGKSAVALEVMYRIQQQYDHVFWLRADSELHLAWSFHEVALGLQLVQDRGDHNHESSRLKLLQWLSTTEATWLLIFDDADELEILPRYMPKSHKGSIIMTSRRLHPHEFSILSRPGLCTIKVHPFGFEEAVAFLRTLAVDAGDTELCEAKLAASTIIGRQYQYLPLILRRLGVMIGRRSLPEDAVIKAILDQHAWGELLSQPGSPLVYGYLSLASDALASVLTCLDPYQINDAILLGAQRCTGFPLKYFPMTDRDYFEAKNELILHALLQPSVDHLAVHRVTHAALRDNLNLVRFGQSLHCASQLLEGRWPSRRKMRNVVLGNWPEFDSLHGHIHELASTYVNYVERLEDIVYEQQEYLNDSLLKVLLLSTWYNARRGNAKEDRPLVRLLHGLIANMSRQKTGLKLDNHEESSSAPLPLRLIDIGNVPSDTPRLVNTAGETGCYVALSHAWSDKRTTKLTRSNMESLQKGIDTSDRQEWQAAIKMTRMLGMRYLWIDSLCILQDDEEEKIETILKMRDIYRFSVATICYAVAEVGDVFLQHESTLSISLNWTQPGQASALEKTLQTSSVWSPRLWTTQEAILSPVRMHWRERVRDQVNGGLGIEAFVEWVPLQAALDLENQSVMQRLLEKGAEPKPRHGKNNSTDFPLTHINSIESAVVYVQNGTQTGVEDHSPKCNEAGLIIDEAAQHAGANKAFEALASFMTAKDLVSPIRPYDFEAQKIHLIASAGICMVYLMQNLPAVGLGMAQSALASQMRFPGSANTLASEIHFSIGSVQNALGHPDEGLKSYRNASKHLQDALNEESETAEWKAVLNLKIAEHLTGTKDYKAAHDLLNQSLEHFQTQDSITAQAHLARALHRQAVIYEGEGSKAMGKAIQAAARATWIGVREARRRPVVKEKGGSALTASDFDAEVEFWYR